VTENLLPAVHPWPSNAALIADIGRSSVPWLMRGVETLDCTWGLGNFWAEWTPGDGCLFGTDIKPGCSPSAPEGVDFTDQPWDDCEWARVVFDPPYKLNGTPDPEVDARYGVDGRVEWQTRMKLIAVGFAECLRIVKIGGFVLVKCQDQVCSGKVRWQTHMLYDMAMTGNWGGVAVLRDRFDLIGKARVQPMKGRKQGHAHGRGSTLLVFERVR
jgi:hypothetical protein